MKLEKVKVIHDIIRCVETDFGFVLSPKVSREVILDPVELVFYDKQFNQFAKVVSSKKIEGYIPFKGTNGILINKSGEAFILDKKYEKLNRYLDGYRFSLVGEADDDLFHVYKINENYSRIEYGIYSIWSEKFIWKKSGNKIIAKYGQYLFSPINADGLHRYDLYTGEILWSYSLKQYLYNGRIARRKIHGVCQNKFIFSIPSRTLAVDVDTGELVWESKTIHDSYVLNNELGLMQRLWKGYNYASVENGEVHTTFEDLPLFVERNFSTGRCVPLGNYLYAGKTDIGLKTAEERFDILFNTITGALSWEQNLERSLGTSIQKFVDPYLLLISNSKDKYGLHIYKKTK